MNKIIFSLPSNNHLAKKLSIKLNIEQGLTEIREFPDGETYIRIDSDVKNKFIFLICNLDHPNNKILTLLFMAKTLKTLGAKSICLITPYLCYMRQDKQFKPGEAVTSTIFAKLISGFIDKIITIDPHLHRIHDLSDLYSIPTKSLHAIKPIAEWILNNIKLPLIIGPDEESSQWVSEIAKEIDSPFLVAHKIRYGDRNVSIHIPDTTDTDRTPVLVDDIISTGTSVCETIKQIIEKKFTRPTCICVHALFNEETQKNIELSGAKKIISCNTIIHPTNGIDITDLLVEEIKKC